MAGPTCCFCQHANPQNAKFCNQCAAALDLRPCTRCEAVNARSATECFRCGAALAAAAAGVTAGTASTPVSASESIVLRAEERLAALRRDALGAASGAAPVPSARDPIAPPDDSFAPDQRGPVTHEPAAASAEAPRLEGDSSESALDALPRVLVEGEDGEELQPPVAYRPPRPSIAVGIALLALLVAGAGAVALMIRPDLQSLLVQTFRGIAPADVAPPEGIEPATASVQPAASPETGASVAPASAAEVPVAPQAGESPRRDGTAVPVSEAPAVTDATPAPPAAVEPARVQEAPPVAAARTSEKAASKSARRATARQGDRRSSQARKPAAPARAPQRSAGESRTVQECTDAVAALGLCRPP